MKIQTFLNSSVPAQKKKYFSPAGHRRKAETSMKKILRRLTPILSPPLKDLQERREKEGSGQSSQAARGPGNALSPSN
jgi:hypothetical protein